MSTADDDDDPPPRRRPPPPRARDASSDDDIIIIFSVDECRLFSPPPHLDPSFPPLFSLLSLTRLGTFSEKRSASASLDDLDL